MNTHHADDATLAYIKQLEAENAALKIELDAVMKDAQSWRNLENKMKRTLAPTVGP